MLRQSFADLELLIVDDGSSDRTVAIARGYAARDARVRVLEQANAGPGPARNCRLPRRAPDACSPFSTATTSGTRRFSPSRSRSSTRGPTSTSSSATRATAAAARDGQPSRPVRGEGRPITLAEILADETSLFIMAVFRREVVDTVGGFDPALLTNEEYEMWIRAALAGFTFTRHTTPLG